MVVISFEIVVIATRVYGIMVQFAIDDAYSPRISRAPEMIEIFNIMPETVHQVLVPGIAPPGGFPKTSNTRVS